MIPPAYDLLALFAAAFLSASLVPFQSEVVFASLLLSGRHGEETLLAVASVGNTLGAVLNWWLGRGIVRFRHRRWFPVSDNALGDAERWFARWGKWSLLLSWVPIVGDPLTVLAGVVKVPLSHFVMIVGLAKTARYAWMLWVISLF